MSDQIGRKVNRPMWTNFKKWQVNCVVYQRIQELRKKRGLSQARIGEVLGMNQRTYAHYEAGDREIPSEVWIALADFYEVTVDYLMGRTE